MMYWAQIECLSMENVRDGGWREAFWLRSLLNNPPIRFQKSAHFLKKIIARFAFLLHALL